MTSQQILQSDVLDILFANRNKLYGAYQLRKMYPQQLLKAVVIAVGSAFLLLLLLRPSASGTAINKEGEKVVVVEQLIPPKEEKKPVLPKAPGHSKAPPVKQQLFTAQLTMTPNEVLNPLPPQELLQNMAVSSMTTTGADASAFLPPIKTDERTNGSSTPATETSTEEELTPDKQPQFPGGVQAWTAFLSRNLQAPQEMEPGEKRTVLIRFHVAEDGSVTNLQVLQSAGYAFDSEVVRVLKKMPRWTPATKAGKPVAVSFTQPVTFVGMEE